MKKYTPMSTVRLTTGHGDITVVRAHAQDSILLTSDVDRLRTEGRERVAKELLRQSITSSDPDRGVAAFWMGNETRERYFALADRILSALFEEGKHDK